MMVGDRYCFCAYGSFQVEAPWRFLVICGKCQKFRHYKAQGKATDLACAKCSKVGHKAKDCPNKVCCPSCSGPHNA
jgi:hypothetical protein